MLGAGLTVVLWVPGPSMMVGLDGRVGRVGAVPVSGRVVVVS